MRNLQPRALSTVSLFALSLAAFPAAASAQTEQQQADAQRVNDQIECSAIADPAARQTCVDRQGETALPESGASSESEIVVTGSRISRPNFETLQPSVVIDSAQIESRGFETLGQAINEQPSFGVPGASPVGGQAGSFGSGQSFVNFLGLGSQRTLTLINGRRFVGSNTASIFGPTDSGSQVDLNSVNTKLVDRIETIAIGGAPIYGSDAIAGTVNVILKRNYQGIDLDAQYGIAEQGDAPNWRFRGLAGTNFADGRGNVVVSGEYNESRGIVYNDRAITRQGRFYGDCPANSTFTQCLYNDRRLPSVSESGILSVGGDVFGLNFPLSPDQAEFLVFGDRVSTFGVTDANGNQLMFNPAGNLIPIDFGTPIGDIPGGDFNTDFSGGNGFNIFNVSQLLTDTKRYNGNVLGNFQLTDNIRAFGEAWYSYSRGTNLREQPVYNSGLFDAAGTPDGPIIIDINNPFLTAAQRATIQNSIVNNPYSDQNILGINQDYFYLSRANTDIASGRATSATEIYRFVGGFDGDFSSIGGRNWNWEVVGNYGHAKSTGKERALVQQNFANAVDAVAGPGGTIVCRPGYTNAAIETFNTTCSPLNLFGSGRLSQAALDYVTTEAERTDTNRQWVFTASMSGPLTRLPGGDLSFALGYEHRDEQTAFDPGTFYFGGDDPNPAVDSNGDGDPANDRTQFGRSVPILPVSGGFNTDEVFGELRAELISPSNSVPFVHSLELHGAARYVDHSIAGADWTWTGEGRWAPVRDIAFRANYTRAIRSPAITEIFNPSSTFFNFANDPCDSDNLGNGPDPSTRQANCLAAGVSPTFQSLSSQRSFHQASQGNVQLENEKSDAWSVGTVVTPRFIPGLTISADWLHINLKDAITSFSATQVLNSCYDSPDYPNTPFCQGITRDSSDQLSFVTTSYFNAASYKYRGLLGALDYRTKTPFLGANSRVGVNLSYQYLDTLTQQSDAASAPATLNGGIGYPTHSAVLNLNYDNGFFGLFTSLNYTGKVKQDPDEAEGFREFQDIDAALFVNGGLSFNVNDRMTFRFVVDNVFDKKPPFPIPAFGGSVSYFPGILGRYYRVGASVHF